MQLAALLIVVFVVFDSFWFGRVIASLLRLCSLAAGVSLLFYRGVWGGASMFCCWACGEPRCADEALVGPTSASRLMSMSTTSLQKGLPSVLPSV
jgi:hypothetical protein